MKKSELKILRERNQKAVAPLPPKKDDISDELSNLFDDGSKLDGRLSPLPAGTVPSPQPTSPPIADAETLPSQTSQTGMTSHTAQADLIQPVAPARDFTKVPNSLTRDVIPAREFKGKSKELYDCLYALTRGAVVARRSVRISRPRLMKLAGIGSRVTFDTNVERLCSIGLIEVRHIVGEHEGNEYTVFLPEERSQTSQTSQTSLTGYAQKVDGLVRLESSQTSHTLSVGDSTTYVPPQTSFKTNKEISDDEAFAALIMRLREAVKKITGTGPSVSEVERWGELAGVLVAELEIAAARTTISSVPSFLAEHLRRRLWKVDKKQARAEGRELPDERASSPQGKDARACVDCGGSGFWYPDGYEKGVAKCRHERLADASPPK